MWCRDGTGDDELRGCFSFVELCVIFHGCTVMILQLNLPRESDIGCPGQNPLRRE